jgi:hypothetical protein
MPWMMNKPSSSPDRHTFQKQGYVKRCEETGESPNQDYLDMFAKILEEQKHKFDDPKDRENNLEYDLLTTDWILEKVRGNDSYAQNLYAALCNTEWQNKALWPTLKEQKWGCSWRYAGGIIADMQGKGDYIDWYCSGIGGGLGNGDEDNTKGYVSEGTVTDEIECDLDRLGWTLSPCKD